jgi:hypothetical protein
MQNMKTEISNQLTEFGARVVTLCDGRQGLRGGIQVEIREPNPSTLDPGPSSPILDFVASDETLDRYDEILVAGGWQLANYRRNPVFQNAHQYGDIIFTLGKALLTEVRGGKLYQRVEFATEINPMARIAYGLYKGKFLNAVSVGFVPIRWENGDGSPRPSDGRGVRGEGFRRRYLEQELLEVSAVGIPANPNALQMGLKAGAIQRADLRELLDLLSGLCSQTAQPDLCGSPAAANTDTSALGVPSNEAQLLQLARELKRLLLR